jgi:hypothetical protein
MAGNGIIEVTDANFDQDVLKSEQPAGTASLGRSIVAAICRSVPHRLKLFGMTFF